ncbi:hypothetical protein H310_07519 [Aphanomyces invadans]|uniref:Uncharacterized protein n=1 Tax=Aphanomyces invadans TaxID=157072 RepID=A0A024U1G2_9STRA|nr:hypothetical protein H310_07519 [Aphanomyces invadans]ETW00094.1 hypothetical protein H310_07519 [Aphanomyces invadans]|eukprot:XP_008871119.1 hypothetical protein H310_07519 [Aphanomyces invadans]
MTAKTTTSTTTGTPGALKQPPALYSWCDASAATTTRRPVVPVPTRANKPSARPIQRHTRPTKQVMPPRNAMKRQQEAMANTRATMLNRSGVSQTVTDTIIQKAKFASAFLGVVPKLM